MSSQNTFCCDFPGCNATYRRKEHLKRHKTHHVAEQSSQCSVCGRVFRRTDTLRRHVLQKHQGEHSIIATRQACVKCRTLKLRCEGGPPCIGCVRRQVPCSFYAQPKGLKNNLNPNQTVVPGRPANTQEFLELYFQRYHPHWPFIHRGSFNPSNEMPLLIQSMVAIGMWVTDVPKTRAAAVDLHQTLNAAIYQQREKWDASIADNVSSICTWPIAMYQAILLHICFTLISTNNISVGLDMKPLIPDKHADLLASLVWSCRKLGMFHYPNMLARYNPDDLPTYVWVGIEEVKRFVLALYRMCNALSSDRITAEMEPCIARWSFSASELQFPPPTDDRLWDATRREEWISATENVSCINLDNMMEAEWISTSGICTTTYL